MEDFRYQMTVDISGKTHSALISFLQKHGQTSHDVSQFVEEAVTWLMIERELAHKHGETLPKTPVVEDVVISEDEERSTFLDRQLEVEERADRAA